MKLLLPALSLLFTLVQGSAAPLSITRSDPDVTFSWPGDGPEKVYTLQSTADVVDPKWAPTLPWENWPISATTHTEPILDGPRFFRLATTERGRVVSVTYLDSITALLLNAFVIPMSGANLPFTATYDVDVYVVEYETLDPFLGPTTVTGALCIPSGMSTPADLFSYQHGTIHRRIDAPSNDGALEQVVGWILASHGYVVAMPDLLGLGGGWTGLHPYVHRRSSATAVIDMLRATRTLLATDPDITATVPAGLSDKLFLFGYSQGGYSTLAAQREMEERHASEFTITASAPSAGPYDLSGVMAEIMIGDMPYNAPNYLPYVLLAYNSIYRLFDSPSEFMVEPYDRDLPPLFDGEHDGNEIDAAMPASGIPKEILKPEFIDGFANDPNHFFRVILRENDLTGWAPVTPTRLYHCGSDTTVPPTNSQIAVASFIAAGADPANVQYVDPDPSGDHGSCLYEAIAPISNWFDSLR